MSISLDEEESQAVAEQARQEYEAEKAGKTVENEPEEAKEEPESPDPEKVEEKQPSEEPAEPQEEAEKTDEEKSKEEVKPKEEAKVEESDDKAVTEWALKHGMTVDEARDDLERTKAVIGKYKSPEEMARALRLTQSAADKFRNELQTKAQETERAIAPSENPRLEVMQHVDANKEQLIEQFRNQNPARTRDMEDDAVLEAVTEKLFNAYEQWRGQQLEAVKKTALQKREELYSSLSASDRNYLADIKAVIDKTDDRSLLSKNFNMTDVIRWAKGGNVDKLVKEAEERGYKRAIEEKRIVGVMPSGSKATSAPSKGKTFVSLTDYEKSRAKEMYGTTSMTDDEMYQSYIETVKSRKKK